MSAQLVGNTNSGRAIARSTLISAGKSVMAAQTLVQDENGKSLVLLHEHSHHQGHTQLTQVDRRAADIRRVLGTPEPRICLPPTGTYATPGYALTGVGSAVVCASTRCLPSGGEQLVGGPRIEPELTPQGDGTGLQAVRKGIGCGELDSRGESWPQVEPSPRHSAWNAWLSKKPHPCQFKRAPRSCASGVAQESYRLLTASPTDTRNKWDELSQAEVVTCSAGHSQQVTPRQLLKLGRANASAGEATL